MILNLHIAKTLHIRNEVFSYNYKTFFFDYLFYGMVIGFKVKKRRGSDVFSNDHITIRDVETLSL